MEENQAKEVQKRYQEFFLQQDKLELMSSRLAELVDLTPEQRDLLLECLNRFGQLVQGTNWPPAFKLEDFMTYFEDYKSVRLAEADYVMQNPTTVLPQGIAILGNTLLQKTFTIIADNPKWTIQNNFLLDGPPKIDPFLKVPAIDLFPRDENYALMNKRMLEPVQKGTFFHFLVQEVILAIISRIWAVMMEGKDSVYITWTPMNNSSLFLLPSGFKFLTMNAAVQRVTEEVIPTEKSPANEIVIVNNSDGMKLLAPLVNLVRMAGLRTYSVKAIGLRTEKGTAANYLENLIKRLTSQPTETPT